MTVTLETRTCRQCRKSFAPRRHDQSCCSSRCRSLLTHNPKGTHRIINAEPMGNGVWYFSAVLGGYSIRGFAFNEETGFVIWPKDRAGKDLIISGPSWWMEDRGLGASSKILSRLMREWLAEHTQHKPVDEPEPEPEPVQQSLVIPKRYRTFALSPCCHQECRQMPYIRERLGSPPKGATEEARLKWMKETPLVDRPALEGEAGDFCKWRCPQCGCDYDNSDSTLDWQHEVVTVAPI